MQIHLLSQTHSFLATARFWQQQDIDENTSVFTFTRSFEMSEAVGVRRAPTYPWGPGLWSENSLPREGPPGATH